MRCERGLFIGPPLRLARVVPVVAGGVLGDDVALQGGERVAEHGRAAAPGLPVDVREAVGAGGRGASHVALVPAREDVDGEAPAAAHA